MRRALQTTSAHLCLALALLVGAAGCGTTASGGADRPELVINEVVSDNEGVHLDESGEADDYVELINTGAVAVLLEDYFLADRSGTYRLPAIELAPGEVSLLWADGTPAQGSTHLPFKIGADGEELRLTHASGSVADAVRVPALEPHRAYQRIPDGSGPFVDCGWATPARKNGDTCGPPDAGELPDDLVFEPYEWKPGWPAPAAPIVISEALLEPATFVEIVNVSASEVDLTELGLAFSRHEVGEPWPAFEPSTAPAPLDGKLLPGARRVIEVTSADVEAIRADPEFEGVVSLVRTTDGTVVDRVDFNAWPAGAVLARPQDDSGRFRFCAVATPGEPNATCEPIADRPVGDRLRRLLTEGDFETLAKGRSALGTDSVEFLIDLAGGDVVTFLNSADYDLHYTFVRQAIEKLPPIDRCAPGGRDEFFAAWLAFSQEQYFRVEGRRYLLGTLVRHAGTGLSAVQFAPGDVISSAQMKHAFFSVLEHVYDPSSWVLRPQTPEHVARAREIEGELPIVSPNAPFRGVTFQPLTAAVSYGTLRFVAASELRASPVGPRDIVVTDQVPNDIPLLGGLVTEGLQTPLSHVNILSRGRGTPNMALLDARTDPRIEPYLDELVRFEVTATDFLIEPADPVAALAFWESRKPSGPPLAPRLDLSVRGVQPLAERSLSDLPSLGGKAAQVAELTRVVLCSSTVEVPRNAIGIPIVHSVEHFEASGARARFDELRADPRFLADPTVRGEGLREVRELIERHPVDPELVREVNAAILERFPGQPLRFRSSSNAEDLPGFSGAGLYESVGVDAEDAADETADAIREVWASLWALRAYDEREHYNVDQNELAMGVLIHGAYRSERVNGVAISRDILDPSRSGVQYFNVQLGEALVTNPAPGIRSEQFTFNPGGWLPFEYHDRSSFTPGAFVLKPEEAGTVGCNLSAIERHFRPLLDPAGENSWFAVDIEFKLMGPERSLVIKQARPYSFGGEPPSNWCDY